MMQCGGAYHPQASQASQARRQLSMDAKQSALARLTEDGWMARSTTKKGFGIIGVGCPVVAS